MIDRQSDDLRQLRNRVAEARARLASSGRDTSSVPGRYLGRVLNPPATVPGVAITNPLIVDAVQKLGGTVTITADTTTGATVPVVVLGELPSVGDTLRARQIAGTWIARKGAKPCGTCRIPRRDLVASFFWYERTTPYGTSCLMTRHSMEVSLRYQGPYGLGSTTFDAFDQGPWSAYPGAVEQFFHFPSSRLIPRTGEPWWISDCVSFPRSPESGILTFISGSGTGMFGGPTPPNGYIDYGYDPKHRQPKTVSYNPSYVHPGPEIQSWRWLFYCSRFGEFGAPAPAGTPYLRGFAYDTLPSCVAGAIRVPYDHSSIIWNPGDIPVSVPADWPRGSVVDLPITACISAPFLGTVIGKWDRMYKRISQTDYHVYAELATVNSCSPQVGPGYNFSAPDYPIPWFNEVIITETTVPTEDPGGGPFGPPEDPGEGGGTGGEAP